VFIQCKLNLTANPLYLAAKGNLVHR
ncbi:MAG: hypothetical protein QOJ17_4972, partial [Rhodospirillaceae bacterium]|nr:hypothetical protein [Rhodospirillaceae bacterium]